jgi:RHS repeat-associated protein
MGGAGDIGGLLAIEDLRAGWQGVFHPSFDASGNLTALHEATTGNMVACYEFDPFGNPVRTSGVYALQNPIRFSGKYFDNETGLSYFGFRYYSASLGRFINRDLLEERGAWNLYNGLKQETADPYAGASGVEGTSWSTEWEQAQDRLLTNTSLPHTTQSVTFDGKRNSGLPGASENNQKTYSANATGHYPQGGAEGTGPKAPSVSVGDPATGNADTNLYIFAGNNPISNFDALGLQNALDDDDDFSYINNPVFRSDVFAGRAGLSEDEILRDPSLSGLQQEGRMARGVGSLYKTIKSPMQMVPVFNLIPDAAEMAVDGKANPENAAGIAVAAATTVTPVKAGFLKNAGQKLLGLGRSIVAKLTGRAAEGAAVKAGVSVAEKGISVIGPRANYRQYAQGIGANYLNVSDKAWTWAKNKQFLKGIIKRGDDVVFAGKFDPTKLNPNSTLAREINYLIKRGYQWNDDFTRLIRVMR